MTPSTNWQKYPRTLHHPSSPGRGHDDKVAEDISWLDGCEVVITEKMDGENTTLYKDGFHARSLDTAYHSSRSWLAGFHAKIAHFLPDGVRLCGENLYARHSVAYDELGSFFLGFSAWREQVCLAWSETIDLFHQIGVVPVPVLYKGRFSDRVWNETINALDLKKQEGLVVRRAESFSRTDFSSSVVKWVRAGHVQSDVHWSRQEIVPNQLAGKSA